MWPFGPLSEPDVARGAIYGILSLAAAFSVNQPFSVIPFTT